MKQHELSTCAVFVWWDTMKWRWENVEKPVDNVDNFGLLALILSLCSSENIYTP